MGQGIAEAERVVESSKHGERMGRIVERAEALREEVLISQRRGEKGVRAMVLLGKNTNGRLCNPTLRECGDEAGAREDASVCECSFE